MEESPGAWWEPRQAQGEHGQNRTRHLLAVRQQWNPQRCEQMTLHHTASEAMPTG